MVVTLYHVNMKISRWSPSMNQTIIKKTSGKWQNNIADNTGADTDTYYTQYFPLHQTTQNRNDLLPHALSKIQIRFSGGFISQALLKFQIVVVTNLW